MKKSLFLFILLPLCFSCENEDTQEQRANNFANKACMMGPKSLSIGFYPVSGHAMKCEAWLSSAYPLNGQKLKCKTTQL